MSYHFFFKMARRQCGLTLTAVSEATGIAPSTLHRYEEALIGSIPAKAVSALLCFYAQQGVFPPGQEPENASTVPAAQLSPEEFERQRALRLFLYAKSRQKDSADFLTAIWASLNDAARLRLLRFLFYEGLPEPPCTPEMPE